MRDPYRRIAINEGHSSKYDQEYDSVRKQISQRNPNNSWSLLVNKINPQSRVLEFGSSSGYLTRYLKEELGCEVFIVEIDSESAERAVLYAQEDYVGDIESFEWAEKWAGEKFDVILFADVLEHLRDPWSTLSVAKDFLKPGGQVFASVPNIAHNSILIELWKNRFTYRSVGLLDSTHIRFFSKQSVAELFESAGLSICSRNYTRVAPEHTEFNNSLRELPWIVRAAFAVRPLSDVYQFIVEAKLPLEG